MMKQYCKSWAVLWFFSLLVIESGAQPVVGNGSRRTVEINSCSLEQESLSYSQNLLSQILNSTQEFTNIMDFSMQ